MGDEDETRTRPAGDPGGVKDARNPADRPDEVEILRRRQRLRLDLSCGDEWQWYSKMPPTMFANMSRITESLLEPPEVGETVVCTFHGPQTVIRERR